MNAQQQPPVVMFHIGRSGSTVLADMLNQRNDLKWGNELYLPIFLRWKAQQGRDEYGRTNPFSLKQLVTNYDELASYLAPTPYAWMLNE
ncbi:MAG: hypothetical protein KC445_07245 [Anaerolineales bacterium]|nr:hypothetical protein [Anaerolineales bacterium]